MDLSRLGETTRRRVRDRRVVDRRRDPRTERSIKRSPDRSVRDEHRHALAVWLGLLPQRLLHPLSGQRQSYLLGFPPLKAIRTRTAQRGARQIPPMTATGIGVNSFLSCNSDFDWLAETRIDRGATTRIADRGSRLTVTARTVCSIAASLPAFPTACNAINTPKQAHVHLNLEWKPMTCHEYCS
jgi:hypothetical protein